MNSKPQKRNEYNNEAPERKKRKPRPPNEITPSYLHNAGLFYLQRFAASRASFHDVMMRKVKKSCLYHKGQDFEACRHMVDELVDKMEELGLLNDDLYAQGRVASQRRQGKSRKAIMANLKNKGIETDMASDTLEAYDLSDETPHDDAELVAALIQARKRKIGPFAGERFFSRKEESEEKRYEKALNAMARAGFSFEISKQALSKTKEEALEIING